MLYGWQGSSQSFDSLNPSRLLAASQDVLPLLVLPPGSAGSANNFAVVFTSAVASAATLCRSSSVRCFAETTEVLYSLATLLTPFETHHRHRCFVLTGTDFQRH